MDEQKVRDAFTVANELVDVKELGTHTWGDVFRALVDEPRFIETPPIVQFLNAMGGPMAALTVKDSDLDFFNKICAQFGVNFATQPAKEEK